ncbi:MULTISPECIES: type II secretion system protein GspK [unclassified Bradyrhizobium]|uniref:general secretion pathway protein GspK n=1 Tax=unclassified Bradyrhizobium TaxID=2631580 RepID=UPI00070D1962|nr:MULTISPECIES: type II secretion system protein GspK [unclassified Bradyrhizobium]KQT03042.1 general secretion pathway protein GspK [Bradyrhizobium sp. Leaf396]
MLATRTRSRKVAPAEDGFIVVVTLWLLVGLTALVTVASVYIGQSAQALSTLDASAQWEMLSSAGVELAAYQLSGPATMRRPSHGGFAFRLANATVRVEYMAESARINLNMAPTSMLAGLFRALGASAEEADIHALRVAAWRSAPKPDGQDTEPGSYQAAGLSYAPRQAPFSSSDELWLVLGLPTTLVERAMSFVTVYSEMAEVNVLDAAPQVIAALPNMTSAKLEAFLSQRAELPRDNPEFVIGALGGRQAGATISASNAYRVRMRITLQDGRQRTPEAVIQMSEPGDPKAFHVLSWTDEVDPERAGRPRQREGR